MMPHRSAHRSIRVLGLPQRPAMPTPPVIRVLPGVPESAAAARQVTRQLLGDGHPAADTAMLLVSELVTNSVMHSRSRRPGGTVTVAVCAGSRSVLIQVRDDGGSDEPRLPATQVTADSAGRPASYGDSTETDDARTATEDRRAASDEHGYGLLLVDALAETWGTLATAEGRVTWCRLAIDPRHRETKV